MNVGRSKQNHPETLHGHLFNILIPLKVNHLKETCFRKPLHMSIAWGIVFEAWATHIPRTLKVRFPPLSAQRNFDLETWNPRNLNFEPLLSGNGLCCILSIKYIYDWLIIAFYNVLWCFMQSNQNPKFMDERSQTAWFLLCKKKTFPCKMIDR